MGGGGGGAVKWASGTLEVNGCGFFFNEANGADWSIGLDGGAGFGGAIFCTPGSTGIANLVNCTLAHNSVKGGYAAYPGQGLGGGLFSGAASADKVSLLNVTIAQNIALGGPPRFDWQAPGPVSSIFGAASLANTLLSCEAGQTNWGEYQFANRPLIDQGPQHMLRCQRQVHGAIEPQQPRSTIGPFGRQRRAHPDHGAFAGQPSHRRGGRCASAAHRPTRCAATDGFCERHWRLRT